MSARQWRDFKALRQSTLKTARAWAISEFAMSLRGYVSRSWAEKGWRRWLSWTVRSRLAAVKEVAKTIKEHLWEILNAVVVKVDNGHAESINHRIKTIKMRGRGFRTKERFRNAIYFHPGGLDLYTAGRIYPSHLGKTHSTKPCADWRAAIQSSIVKLLPKRRLPRNNRAGCAECLRVLQINHTLELAGARQMPLPRQDLVTRLHSGAADRCKEANRYWSIHTRG